MAPCRRLVLALAAAMAVVVALVLVGVAVLGGRGGSSPAADPARQGTVLVVAGYGGGRGGPDALAAALRRAGRAVRVVPVAGDGTGDLHAQARALGAAARAAVRSGAPSVDVVGYSAGGVVARVWLAGGTRVPVRRVVTLGSPHHGTELAAQAADLAAGSCPAACRQLVPGSDLLASLPTTPGSAAWTSVWSEADEVVTPPRTASALAGAVEVDVQAVCPGADVTHEDLPRGALGVGLVDAVLDAAPLRSAPPPSRCAALLARGRRLLSS